MKYYTILALSLILISSCNKENIELEQVAEENKDFIPENCSQYFGCIDIPDVIESLGSCEDEIGVNLSWCDIIPFGSFSLEETSKEYLPQFCNEVESTFKYKNINGDSILFKMICKQFYRHLGIHSSGNSCEIGNGSIGYCVDTETARLTIKSDTPEIELLITLTTIPDTRDTIIGNIGDQLRISRKNAPIEFFAIIDNRTLSYDKVIPYEERFDSIELNNNLYFDVISNSTTEWEAPRFKYYYNRETGLIGFTDTEENTWTIE